MSKILPVVLFLCVFVPRAALAQPVPPAPGVALPQAYFDRIAQDKTAFQFQRAWIQKAERAREARREFMATQWRPGMTATSLPEAVKSSIMVSGTIQVPVFLAKYSNTTVTPYPASDLQTKLFAAPPAASMTALYDEMSYGNLTLSGNAYDWVPLSGTDVYYEGGCNGLCGSAKTGQLLLEVLQAVDPSVDFGQYDNDGPDGVPNSGDDDGFVDFVAFVQPETGGECGTTNIWSHRYVVGGWPEFGRQPWVTNDPRSGGGNIYVWDYTIQPALGSANGCGESMIEIGVFCHEFGHAFGLPDLYDTNTGSEGIGHWGLMGSGNWNKPNNPAHLEAWSKAELGWILPTEVGPFSQPYTVDNAEVTPEVFKLAIMEQKFSRKSVAGSQRLHCGLTLPEATTRVWPKGAGYGNSWDESVRRDFTYNGANPVTLQYDYMYDTEPNYDYGYVKIDVNGTVSTLNAYTGMGSGHAVVDLTPYLNGSGASSYKLIAHFRSDQGWSDEDGDFDSGAAGPFAIDNVSVIGGGENYSADFEQNDNGWYYDFSANPSKEYFLVENRNIAGAQFDQNLHGEGLAIWHVEQNMMAPGGLANTGGDANTTIHGVTLEEADGLDHLFTKANRGDAGDVYPGSTSNTAFTNATTPDSKSFNNAATRCLVENVSGPGAQMTATMRGGHLPPVLSSVHPAFGYNDRTATIDNVSGLGFVHGATFLLRDASQNEYAATSVEWVGRTKLAGVFNLDGLTKGIYDFVVRNPDGQEAVIDNGFLVKDIVPVFIQTFAAQTTEKGIELTWDILSDEGIQGFRIWRCEAGSTLEEALGGGELVAPERRTYVDETVLPATNYEYFLTVVLSSGAEQRSRAASARSAAPVLGLQQNSPNPFNPDTRIRFTLPERMHVTLAVYDARGSRVATLVDETRPAGMNDVVWDGRNERGSRAASGVYFYRLTTPDRVLTRKMLLLK